MASQDWFEKDFYAILGVSQDASEDDIKHAYRKLARKYHPDANPDNPEAEAKFKEIGEANQVLSNPEERQQYDAIRQMARGGARFGGGYSGAGGGAGASDAGGFEDIFSSMFGGGAGPGGGGSRYSYSTGGGGSEGIDLEDLLNQFGGGYSSGGGFGGGGRSRGYSPRPRAGADVEARTTITFRQAVDGDTVHMSTPEGNSMNVRIPAGVKDGQKIKLRGKGQSGQNGGPAGDMILHVTVLNDDVFGRDGNNLTVDLPVTFAEATLGATVQVPTIDGKTVKVKVKAGTPSGRSLRIKGRGIKAKKATGDLIAHVQIVVPTHLTDEQRAAVETLAEGEPDPRTELLDKARRAAS